MKLAAAFALLLLASTASAAPDAAQPGPRRRALVVGIDRYAASARWSDLEGAANDARDVAALLVARFGYRPEDVTVLLDRTATREAILGAWRHVLVEPAAPGDLGVFYYAGHGSQILNLLSPKPGHLDETIFPSDGRDIRDVELGRLAEEAADRGLRLTVVLDSCHSGSATRGLAPGGKVRAGKPEVEHPISDGSPRPAPEKKGVLTLSAARAEQLAGEAVRDGVPHGAFTAALLDTLAGSAPEVSAEAVHVRVNALVKALRASQDPGLEGSAERRAAPLFTPPMGGAQGKPVVAMAAVKDGLAELRGGAAMGLSEGATLVRAGAGPQVRLTVKEVLGFARATARVAAPQDGDLAGVATGDLFEVERPALAAPEPLRIEVGEPLPLAAVEAAARALAPLKAAKGLFLVADPVAEAPTHVLSWRGGAWRLTDPDGREAALGARVDAAAVLKALRPGVKGGAPPALFVRLPVPAEVAARLPWPADARAPVVAERDPARADDLLAGRPGIAGPEYALLRRGATAKAGACATDLQVPARTDWQPLPTKAQLLAEGPAGMTPVQALAARLDGLGLRLGRVHAWLTLRAPQDDPDFPWRLEITEGGRPAGEAAVGPQAKLSLALVRTGPGAVQRFPYVFAIDCKGAIDVAWPEPGRQPDKVPAAGAAGDRIPLNTVDLDGTVGRYTFLLMAADEPIPSVETIVQGAVTRGPPPQPDTLEGLLLGLGRSRGLAKQMEKFVLQRASLLAAPPP